MALRWLAKIMPHKPVYVVQKRVLTQAAEHIDELEIRQVLMEAVIERLIDDGDHAIYMRGMKYNRSWRETKQLAAEMAPDVEQVLILTSGMRVYRGPLQREYDDDPVLRADTDEHTPGAGITGINAQGKRVYTKTSEYPLGDNVCRYPGESRRPAFGVVTGRMSSTQPNITDA